MKSDIVLEDAEARYLYLNNQERLPMFTVTENPTDYPGHFVARLCVTLPGVVHTPYVLVRNTLEELRAAIPPECACLTRSPGDDPKIVETWL